MRRVAMILLCVAGLAACKPAADPDNELVMTENSENGVVEEPAPGPYVPGRGEHPGENEMRTANTGQYYYRDLPAALSLRGDWTVRKVAWLPVSGRETPRSPERMRGFEGARIHIDRQKIAVTPRSLARFARVTLDCDGVGYLDRDRLLASMQDSNPADVLLSFAIAVRETDISEAFGGLPVGPLLSLFCPLSDTGDAEAGEYPDGYPSGVMPIDERRMVLIFSDGILLYAQRNAQ
ncbi:MAG: hypothetical protein ACAH11_02295 [Sphingomonas sp.]